MHRSLFLARLIGPLLIIIGLSILLNGAVYRAMADEFLKSHALIYLSGILALTAGLALINAHNVWSDDWRVIITILGWFATVGGTVRILIPQQVEAIGHAAIMHQGMLIGAAILVMVLGAALSYFGYYEPVRAAAIVSAARRASARPPRTSRTIRKTVRTRVKARSPRR